MNLTATFNMRNRKIQTPLYVFQLVVLTLSLAVSGCAKKQKDFSVSDAVTSLEEQASKLTTVKGRAWVNIQSGKDTASFAGVLVVDRSDPKKPNMRLEALDPFGGLHHLLIIDSTGTLKWADQDAKVLRERSGNWHGIPLKLFPQVVLGVVAPSSLQAVGLGKIKVASEKTAGSEDSFVVETEVLGPLSYVMAWVNPGNTSRLGLVQLAGKVHRESGNTGPFSVEYSQFGDKEDFYLPATVRIKALPDFEMRFSWRDREYNEPLERSLFQISPALRRELKREAL